MSLANKKDNALEQIRARRQDFPILNRLVHNHPLAYLDNAATTQKPQAVIDAVSAYYTQTNANIHRGVHQLSEEATAAYESARTAVQAFIHALSHKEIIFTRGTTEAINLVACSYGSFLLKAGDEILLSQMEHHANIVPWQLIAEKTGANIRVIPLTPIGEIDLEAYAQLLTKKTRIVGLVHASNALGTINPVAQMIRMAHQVGAKVLIDGAQAIAHFPIDVQALDCDFYCFSGHKLYAPTGIGVLYAKAALLDAMPPYQGGGEMIKHVSFEKTTYHDLPHKFEAGTPHISGALGLKAAIDYLNTHDFIQLSAYEMTLFDYATAQLRAMPDITLIGTAKEKVPVISFIMAGVHPHDIGTILDQYGVAVRTGHHCAMPVMRYFQVPATVRLSLSFYNNYADIDQCMQALTAVRRLFA